MKNTLLFSILLVSSLNAFSMNDCSAQAEQYLHDVGWSTPAEFVGLDKDLNQIYYVRTNLQGGDAAYEVVTSDKCAYISHKLLWSE